MADTIARHLERLKTSPPLPVFQLLGNDSESKLMIARHTVTGLNLTLYRMPADALPTQTADQETFVRLWQRESVLLPIALYIDAAQLDRAGSPQTAAVQRFFSRSIGIMFFDAREPWPEIGRDSVSLDVAKPMPTEQQAAWAEALGEASGDHPSRLAGQFNLNVPTIRGIAANVLALSAHDRSALGTALWNECLSHSRPALDQLAQALEPKAAWDDLELAATEKGLLRQIAEQVKARMAVYDDWGFRAAYEPRPRHQRAVCRRERHGQDDGRGGHRQRAAA